MVLKNTEQKQANTNTNYQQRHTAYGHEKQKKIVDVCNRKSETSVICLQ